MSGKRANSTKRARKRPLNVQPNLHIEATENPACAGTFFEDYALQISLTLDTRLAKNITARDTTLANVGSG